MSLKIKVNYIRKSKLFYAGDEVSGVAIATGPINDDSTVIQMHFKGKSQTRLSYKVGHQKVVTTDKVRFFTMTQVLFRGACQIAKDSSQSWPFSFQLPLFTEPENGNPKIVYCRRINNSFAKAKHPLPPSMSLSGRSQLTNCKALISYELRAELHRGAFFSRSLKTAGKLPVGHCRSLTDEDPPNPEMTTWYHHHTHASSRLLPDHATRSRSVREWASDRLTRNAPSVSFNLSVRSPKTLIEGQQIPIQFCLTYEPEKSTTKSLPEVRLLGTDYELKEYTPIRGISTLWKRDHIVTPSTIAYRHKLTAKADMIATLLNNNEVIDVGALHKVVLPNKMIPTFDSYSICRSYAARLKVRLECAGKKFNATFEWKPVLILPKEVEAPESSDDGSAEMLSRASSMSVLSIGGAAVEILPEIVNAIVEVAMNC